MSFNEKKNYIKIANKTMDTTTQRNKKKLTLVCKFKIREVL